MGRPAGDLRCKPISEAGPGPEKSAARSAAEPLQHAADKNVDAEEADVDRNTADRVIGIEDKNCAHSMRFLRDRPDIQNIRAPEQHVRDGNKKSSLIDGIEEALSIDRNAVPG